MVESDDVQLCARAQRVAFQSPDPASSQLQGSHHHVLSAAVPLSSVRCPV